ncbi:MAG: hypothetical protein WC314_26970 [Vulcanimicrobiota bacterium]
MPRGRIYKHETKVMHLNLPVPVHAALMHWAKVSGVPASRFVVAVLTENLPAIEAMTKAMQAAKAGQADALEGLKSLMLNQIAGAQELAGLIDQNEKGDA